MTKPKTHFEQVPLEIVVKTAEILPPDTTGKDPTTKKKKAEAELLEAGTVNRRGKNE